MLIKAGSDRINTKNITSYKPDMKSSIIIYTVDGASHPVSFMSETARDNALLQLDEEMSQDGFLEL